MTAELLHALERTILICAERSTVFRFFTDSKRFADWWGEGSTIEGRAGGAVRICYPGGVLASGKILEIVPPERIVITYGYDSGKPFPPGESQITITLAEHPDGTELTLRHEFSDPSVLAEHTQGWRYQLALFANVASRDQLSDVQSKVDAYFDLWNTADANSRLEKMDRLLEPEMRFQDKYSCTFGLEDLNSHLSAYQKFMPGMTIARDGQTSQCQGTVLSRWVANKADGTQVGRGLNVFTFTPKGQIARVTGFWE